MNEDSKQYEQSGGAPPPTGHTVLTSGLQHKKGHSGHRQLIKQTLLRSALAGPKDVDGHSPDEFSVKTANICPPTDCMVNGCSRGTVAVLDSKPSSTVSSSFRVKLTCKEVYMSLTAVSQGMNTYSHVGLFLTVPNLSVQY